MKDRDFSDYIKDILISIQDIDEFTSGMEFDEFLQDKKTINTLV